ncbi:MAG TPA: efflux RND transporter permease subunit [Candidatus Kapabacteria bacterium]|nr:efflux RND transporter permease subunit [Candidatus Kapabacteria bacterium]
MTLTELSIKRPTLIIIIFTALGVLGFFSFGQLKYELLPKISSPVVTISTIYPGASPQEVESSVTKHIEDAVSGIDQVSTMYSTSQEGLSFVTIEFLMSADIDKSLQDVQRKVNEIASTLPTDAKTPTISKFALDELPVLRMGVTSGIPSRDFYQLLKDRIKPRLSKIAGVGEVTLVGGDEREIRVNLDQQKLQSYGLSVMQVTNVIKSSNLDFPTGNVKEGDAQYVVRIAGKFTSVDALRALVIATSRQGGDIKLSDVAEVQDGQKDYETISRLNGKTAVGVLVQKQTDANSVDVSKLVRDEIPKIEKDYASDGVKFDIAEDASTFTLDAANGVKEDLMLAIVLVAIVMLMFLHSIRNSAIVMVAIPSSMVSTFIAMYIFGFTLNLMTLLGLSLVVGILVDDSIVVLENIYRHLEMGQDQKTASIRGRNEIGFAALSITMVDIVVFVPLALVSGLIGNIMREFALVVVFSTLMSLFVSFTITPMLASRFTKLEHYTKGTLLGRFALWFEKWYEKLAEEYGKLLKWGLHNRWKVMLGALALFFAAIALVPLGFIGSEFIAVTDRGEFTVTLELQPGSTIENTNYVTQKVEKIVSAIPEVKKVFTNVGTSSEGLVGQSSNNNSELNITLTPLGQRKRSTDDVIREIKNKTTDIPGVKVRVNPIGIFGTANQTPIQAVVSAPTYDEAQKGAAQLMGMIQKIPGTADVRLSSEEGKPETRIEIDRTKLASFGLSLAEVGATLRVALTGDDDSKFRDGSDDYDIRIILDQFDRSKTLDIGDLTFINPAGEKVQLKQFANVYQTTGPTKLQRQDRNYSVTVYSQAEGRPSGSIGQDITNALAKNPLPKGTTLSYLGDLKNQNDSFGSLGLALMAAILFVYMIMVALYDSFIYPFVVLFSIPVAIIGALLALALTMKSLSIFSILGIIMLVGLVGKNAILLVDRANQMRKEKGMDTLEALMEAGNTRLRPILMTTVAMVFGMLPIAMSNAAGTEWKSGLAWAIIGGLISSLLLTLLLVPVMYVKVDQWRVGVPAFFRKVFRIKAVPAAPEFSAAPVVETGK